MQEDITTPCLILHTANTIHVKCKNFAFQDGLCWCSIYLTCLVYLPKAFAREFFFLQRETSKYFHLGAGWMTYISLSSSQKHIHKSYWNVIRIRCSDYELLKQMLPSVLYRTGIKIWFTIFKEHLTNIFPCQATTSEINFGLKIVQIGSKITSSYEQIETRRYHLWMWRPTRLVFRKGQSETAVPIVSVLEIQISIQHLRFIFSNYFNWHTICWS